MSPEHLAISFKYRTFFHFEMTIRNLEVFIFCFGYTLFVTLPKVINSGLILLPYQGKKNSIWDKKKNCSIFLFEFNSGLQSTPLKKKTDAKKELIITKREEDEDEESEEEWEDVEGNTSAI